ncbi:hypothetical protein [Nitrospira sp. Nam74]
MKSTNSDLEFANNATIPQVIPPGDHYEVAFTRAEREWMWGQEKLFLWFKIITPGPWLGAELYMACNAAPKGRWTPSYKFWCAYVLAHGDRPNRADRISTAVFRGKVFRARIRTVKKTAKQSDRTPAQQYSVIDEVLERLTG